MQIHKTTEKNMNEISVSRMDFMGKKIQMKLI